MLIGAVTVLVVLVGVFLAYNANNGLPFVPTYDVWAQLPSGANLVRDNEVRVGGFRVGLVDKIVPMYDALCTRCGTELDYPEPQRTPQAVGAP